MLKALEMPVAWRSLDSTTESGAEPPHSKTLREE
jgi:hypothetical protein